MRVYRTSSMHEIHKIRVGQHITCELTDICHPQFVLANATSFIRTKMMLSVWYRKQNKKILLWTTGYQYQNGKLMNKGVVDFQFVNNLKLQLEQLCKVNILSRKEIKATNQDMINNACTMALISFLGV